MFAQNKHNRGPSDSLREMRKVSVQSPSATGCLALWGRDLSSRQAQPFLGCCTSFRGRCAVCVCAQAGRAGRGEL